MKKIHIFSGGTVSHVRNHLALCAPAYGETGRVLADICDQLITEMDTHLWQSRMAGGNAFETPLDLAELVDDVVSDLDTKIVFFPAAVIDVEGVISGVASGKHAERYDSRKTYETMELITREKIISRIRRERKDIFLVGFKTTCDDSRAIQISKGMHLLKSSSCNLVLVNDVVTRENTIVTPEDGVYKFKEDRHKALEELVEMSKLRSHLTFTRSTVVAGSAVPWTDDRVPTVMREVMNHCVRRGAYSLFLGYTPGHFAIKIADNEFLTSRRKTNFNESLDLVRVVTDGPDSVIAYGFKPSVGGQSQRAVFESIQDANCIVHFHRPLRDGSEVPVMSQREYECGSHECGNNTVKGLKKFGNLWAMHLDNHGPNIVFDSKQVKSQEVINFIERNWEL